LNSVTRCRPVLARRSAFNPARRPACLLTRRPARGSRLDSSVPNILLLSCHGIDRPPPLRRGRRRPPHPPSRGVPRPLQHAGHHPPLLPRDRLGPPALRRGHRQPFPPPSARRPTAPSALQYRARAREEVTSIHRVWPACSRQSRSEFPVLAGVDSTSVGVDFFCSVSRLLDFQHAPPASSARCELGYCSFAD
jgi:hypothetical protein